MYPEQGEGKGVPLPHSRAAWENIGKGSFRDGKSQVSPSTHFTVIYLLLPPAGLGGIRQESPDQGRPIKREAAVIGPRLARFQGTLGSNWSWKTRPCPSEP